jgi:hypothetical protein
MGNLTLIFSRCDMVAAAEEEPKVMSLDLTGGGGLAADGDDGDVLFVPRAPAVGCRDGGDAREAGVDPGGGGSNG